MQTRRLRAEALALDRIPLMSKAGLAPGLQALHKFKFPGRNQITNGGQILAPENFEAD
jgi:hypothetical protein